ncbi:hypothetical protein HYPBUDRAFT_10229 [Hyphopichia burtonii NRRL Y-1933]|uniref:Uncharacterized protein n=1 Tax=Hyphopichia burtonii NRRL Y-1933 TaxID=984485 RepID=A0A1E4RNH0_9ASCO|nr:hypothetical protein HYPBUDRAFT_10229 [Hyphopichia burtonii NRRL Y-1933]ODV68799.1 hypothetical protein HYPBUDRAFT_10229 [Hyphopichia burtonii NRRL Y-1933]
MKFSTILSAAAALTFVNAEVTSKANFGVVTIHSGSSYQYGSINKDSDKLLVNGKGDAVTFNLKNGELTDQDNAKIAPGTNGFLATSSKSDTSFSVKDDRYLVYNGQDFYACPDGGNTYLSTKSCENGVSVELLAQ